MVAIIILIFAFARLYANWKPRKKKTYGLHCEDVCLRAKVAFQKKVMQHKSRILKPRKIFAAKKRTFFYQKNRDLFSRFSACWIKHFDYVWLRLASTSGCPDSDSEFKPPKNTDSFIFYLFFFSDLLQSSHPFIIVIQHTAQTTQIHQASVYHRSFWLLGWETSHHLQTKKKELQKNPGCKKKKKLIIQEGKCTLQVFVGKNLGYLLDSQERYGEPFQLRSYLIILVLLIFFSEGIFIPGTPNNHFKMDVWWNNHFLCKDLESSNWNNHL